MHLTTFKLSKGTSGRCAFCKHWYDPANSHITPHNPMFGQWKADVDAVEICTLNNMKRKADKLACSKYECKVNIC